MARWCLAVTPAKYVNSSSPSPTHLGDLPPGSSEDDHGTDDGDDVGGG